MDKENKAVEVDSKRSIIDTILITICIIIGITMSISFIYYFCYSINFKEIHSGELTEIRSGVYVEMYDVRSNVPAYNTTVATVYVGDTTLEVSGHIEITYTNDIPSYEWTETRIVNGDKLKLKVPRGTVVRLNTVSTESRSSAGNAAYGAVISHATHFH